MLKRLYILLSFLSDASLFSYCARITLFNNNKTKPVSTTTTTTTTTTTKRKKVVRESPCIVTKDVEIERTLSVSKKTKKDPNVVIHLKDLVSGESAQMNPPSSTLLSAVVLGRYEVLDVAGDSFMTLMGEESGENREDLTVPDDDIGSTIRSEFEEGNQVVIKVARLGDGKEIIVGVDLPDAQAAMVAAAEEAKAAAAAARLAKENDPRVLSRALCVAVATGNLAEVTRLVEDGRVDLCAKASGQGLAPLHLALYEGHNDIAELLVRNNANVTDQTGDGSTPLHLAVDKARPSLVDLILGLPGVLVDAKDNQGWAPLHLAANNGRPKVVKQLASAGCDMNIRTIGMWNALHAAANNGHALLCIQLLAAGVDHTAVNDENLTPQGQAVRAERKEAARALAFPLHFAAQCGNVSLVTALLTQGFSLETKDLHGKIPADYAKTDEHVQIFRKPENHTEVGRALSMINRADVASCFFQLNYTSVYALPKTTTK